MRIGIQKRGLVPAAVVAVLGTVLLYLASTAGYAAWRGGDSAPVSGRGYLPSVLENAPEAVPTTDVYGPPGPVAVVYAGTDVDDGLTGAVERPWLTVSAVTGDYRALVAPGLPLPAAGAMSTSPDGTRLAWAGPDGVVLYDTGTGESRTAAFDAVDVVGPFSSDAGLVAVHADGVRLVDVASGEVVAEAPADPRAVAGAAWRPDGSGLDLVVSGELLTLSPDGTSRTQPTTIPAAAELAWSPQGDRLADLRNEGGTHRLYVSELRSDGRVAPAERVEVPGISLQHLFGFSGERSIAADAFVLESGSVERVLDVSLDTGSTSDLTTLPAPGPNWVDASTVSVASDTLRRGSYEWPSQLWPWSYAARLAACALLMFFLFGLYVTRRPRTR